MTRREWESDYPGYQTRYLAFCEAKGFKPSPLMDSFQTFDFMTWIRAKDTEFRKLHGLKGDYVPMPMMDEFTAYLWGEG